MHDPTDLSAVPLFPLPTVVLFPRAVIPLHIFEPRYQTMTADVLEGSRQIAMALLKEGWQRDYYGRPPIEPVVCVGNILAHERLADGTYNFLLQGQVRARIVKEHPDRPYRIAQLERLEESNPPESALLPLRKRLTSAFDAGSLLATGIGRQFRQLLTSPLPTAEVADLIAFNFLEDLALKQALLCECDVVSRVTRIVAEFEAARPLPVGEVGRGSGEPSLN